MYGDSLGAWGSVLCGLSPLLLATSLAVLVWLSHLSRERQRPPSSLEIGRPTRAPSSPATVLRTEGIMPRRPLGSSSFARLCELLGHEDEITRASACAELGLRGRESARAIEKLARAAGYDDEGIVRGAATVALASIASTGGGLEEQVLEALARTSRATQYPVTAYLAHAVELVELAIVTRA